MLDGFCIETRMRWCNPSSGFHRALTCGAALLLCAASAQAESTPIPHGTLELIARNPWIAAGGTLDLGLRFQRNGQRVVSPEWAHRATSPLEKLRNLQYGYLWWSITYPYKDRTGHAFFAGGNGGQLVMGIPDLDLVVTFYAGNYSDPVLYKIQEDLVPQYILPAVDAQK